MTSRERLLKAIRKQPVDRVPICIYELCGYDFDAWFNSEPSYKKLMDYIREKTDCVYMVDPEFVRKPLENCHVEQWREGIGTYTRTVISTPKGDLTELTRVDDNIHTLWRLEYFLKSVDDINKYLAIPYDVPDISMDRFYREQSQMGENGIMLITFSDPVCDVADLFGMEQLLVNLLCETDRMKYFLDAIFERKLAELKVLLKNDVRDVLFRLVGPEYLTPPYAPYELFSDFVTRYHIKFAQMIHDAGGLVRIHSHGKIKTVLDDFVKIGADAIDPVEPPPHGDIELTDVKRLYGDKLCLFGNIELLELEGSEPQRIEMLVKQAMDGAKDGGGFVLMPTATPINVPLSPKTEQNIITMIDAGLRYGSY